MAASFENSLHTLIAETQQLKNDCEQLSAISGYQRLKSKIASELIFFQKLRKTALANQAQQQLCSTNLPHLKGIFTAASQCPTVCEILRPINTQLYGRLVIDVICNGGFTWVKVVARNSQALHLSWQGHGQFGGRNIEEQIVQFLNTAEDCRHCFTMPRLVVWFFGGVTKPLAAALQHRGVIVIGTIVEVDSKTSRMLLAVTNDDGADDDDSDDKNKVDLLTDKQLENSDDENSPTQCDSNYGKYFSKEKVKNSLEVNNQCLLCIYPQVNKQSEAELLSGSVAEVPDLSDLSISLHVNSGSDKKSDSPVDVSLEFKYHDVANQHQKTGDVTILFTDIKSLTNRMLPFEDCTLLNDVGFPLYSGPALANLDITTMICLVSNLCNGGSVSHFNEQVLAQQAIRERLSPVLPSIRLFLQGKQVIACETAVREFRAILQTVGGRNEIERAEKLLNSVTVVPDNISKRVTSMTLTSKVKERARVIFGTGDSHQAITITANTGFVRGALSQGVNLAVYIHESRALTEQKER